MFSLALIIMDLKTEMVSKIIAADMVVRGVVIEGISEHEDTHPKKQFIFIIIIFNLHSTDTAIGPKFATVGVDK